MRSQGVVKQSMMAGALALAFGFSVSAQAQTWLVDFGNNTSYRGASVVNPDQNGNYWNSVWSGAYYPNLLDSTGASTPGAFGFVYAGGTDSYNGPAGATDVPPLSQYLSMVDIDAAALGNLGATNAAFDFYTSSGFVLQGFDPALQYNLTFYGSHKYSADAVTVYSVCTDNTFGTVLDSVSLQVDNPSDPSMHNRDQVAVLSGISPQSDTTFYIKFEGMTIADSGYLNSMEISVVPEPTIAALLGLGTLGLALIRRRRA